MKKTLPILKALADRNRLRIVSTLMQHKELCACQLTELLQVTGATVSRHLTILVQSGVLISRKEGRWIYFRINSELHDLVPLLEWIQHQIADCAEIARDQKAMALIVATDPEALCRSQRGEKCCPSC